jgi:hypothetical protein
MTGKPEVIPQGRRWPLVSFEEIAVDVLQARFWIVCVGYNPSRMDGGAVLEL